MDQSSRIKGYEKQKTKSRDKAPGILFCLALCTFLVYTKPDTLFRLVVLRAALLAALLLLVLGFVILGLVLILGSVLSVHASILLK